MLNGMGDTTVRLHASVQRRTTVDEASNPGHEEARQYAEHGPFVLAGLVEDWHIREWANIFR